MVTNTRKGTSSTLLLTEKLLFPFLNGASQYVKIILHSLSPFGLQRTQDPGEKRNGKKNNESLYFIIKCLEIQKYSCNLASRRFVPFVMLTLPSY